MRVTLIVRWEDIEKYERGEVIEASRPQDKSEIFEYYHGDLMEVSLPTRDIIGREDKVVRGMVKGTFSKFLIQKM
jgi:hypothetical protein